MTQHWHIGIQPAISFLLLLLIVGTGLRLLELYGMHPSAPAWFKKVAGALSFMY